MSEVVEINNRYMKDKDGDIFFPIVHITTVLGLVNATDKIDGLMSKEDKRKLNNLTHADSNGSLGSVFYKEVTHSANYTNTNDDL